MNFTSQNYCNCPLSLHVDLQVHYRTHVSHVFHLFTILLKTFRTASLATNTCSRTTIHTSNNTIKHMKTALYQHST